MAEVKPIILFVDDDPMLLASTKRRLTSLARDWDMKFCESGLLALQMIERVEPAAVITDMRMPTMDGVALLTEVLQRYPLAVRIILSGQTEAEKLNHAHVVAHEILRKPCEAENIRSVVGYCLRIRGRLSKLQLPREIFERSWIPIYPTSISDTLMLLHDQHHLTEQLVAAMRSDPEVSQLVVNRLARAIGRVKSHPMPTSFTPETVIATMGVFATKSTFCFARIARRIVAKVDHPLLMGVLDDGLELGLKVMHASCHAGKQARFGEECFIAAIFQEIGKLVMYACFGEEYINLLIESQDREIRMAELETSKYGYTHAEVGAYLLLQWSFSPHVIESVCSHEDAVLSSPESLSSVVNFVRNVACSEMPVKGD
jgi:CheY-like chemotaxis protein